MYGTVVRSRQWFILTDRTLENGSQIFDNKSLTKNDRQRKRKKKKGKKEESE